MRSLKYILPAALLLAFASQAQQVTYTKDIAPILIQKCINCHRPESSAPMSLMTYEEARPWAKSIREQVVKRNMPPWFADPEHGSWSNDPSLTQEEIDLVETWVNTGARRGSPKDMPELPEFKGGWQLGEPDYVITAPEATIPADGEDLQITYKVPVEADKSNWVRAIEVRPSNRVVAHHSVVFINDYPTDGQNADYSVLGVWAVDTPPQVYPEGTGRSLENIDHIVLSQHYHPDGVKEQTDITKVGLYFGEGEMGKELYGLRIGDYSLEIPAYEPNHPVSGSWVTPQDLTIHSFYPHMHYRGKDMTFTATYPSGESEILLRVPEYNFNWQLFYYPEEPVHIPAGTTIDVQAHFDNSEKNPFNPDPSAVVPYGEGSEAEMMFGIFEYTADARIVPELIENQLSPEQRERLAIITLVVGFSLLAGLIVVNTRYNSAM